MLEELTQTELKQQLHYDETTGFFTWIGLCPKNFIGKQAGTFSKQSGYINIQLLGKFYRAHRLSWLYMTGKFPNDEIDHINHNRADNRFENLRDVDATTNQRNRELPCTNTSEVSGVNWDKKSKQWRARISVDSKRINLGLFPVFSEAVDARKNAEVLYGYHENHGKRIQNG